MLYHTIPFACVLLLWTVNAVEHNDSNAEWMCLLWVHDADMYSWSYSGNLMFITSCRYFTLFIRNYAELGLNFVELIGSKQSEIDVRYWYSNSVCPSVCPSRSCIFWKWLNILL